MLSDYAWLASVLYKGLTWLIHNYMNEPGYRHGKAGKAVDPQGPFCDHDTLHSA